MFSISFFPFFIMAFFLFSFQISMSVLAVDMTATPTHCALTLLARIVAFVKKAMSVTDFNAKKKANNRKGQNQDIQSKEKTKKRY